MLSSLVQLVNYPLSWRYRHMPNLVYSHLVCRYRHLHNWPSSRFIDVIVIFPSRSTSALLKFSLIVHIGHFPPRYQKSRWSKFVRTVGLHWLFPFLLSRLPVSIGVFFFYECLSTFRRLRSKYHIGSRCSSSVETQAPLRSDCFLSADVPQLLLSSTQGYLTYILRRSVRCHLVPNEVTFCRFRRGLSCVSQFHIWSRHTDFSKVFQTLLYFT